MPRVIACCLVLAACGQSNTPVYYPEDAGNGCMTQEQARHKYSTYEKMTRSIPAPDGNAPKCQILEAGEAPDLTIEQYACTDNFRARLLCDPGGKACYHVVSNDGRCDYGWWVLR
jgi:predicted small lipoprotein YifL